MATKPKLNAPVASTPARQMSKMGTTYTPPSEADYLRSQIQTNMRNVGHYTHQGRHAEASQLRSSTSILQMQYDRMTGPKLGK